MATRNRENSVHIVLNNGTAVTIIVTISATYITEEERQKAGRLWTWFNRKLLMSSRIQMFPLALLCRLK